MMATLMLFLPFNDACGLMFPVNDEKILRCICSAVVFV